MTGVLLFPKIARTLRLLGYGPIPIKRGTKAPRPKGWQDGDFADRAHEFENDFTGLRTRTTPGIDIDVSDPELVRPIVDIVCDVLGCRAIDLPARVGNAPRTLLVCRTDVPFSKRSTAAYDLPTDPVVNGERKPSRVEILADGQQFVAYADHPDTHRPYTWITAATPLNTWADDLVHITAAQADEIVRRCDALLAKHGKRLGGTSAPSTAVDPPGEIDLQAREDAQRYDDTPVNRARLLSALKSLDPDADPSRDGRYMTIIYGLHSTGWTDWRELAESWATGEMHGITSTEYDEEKFRKDVKGLNTNKPKAIKTVASIFWLAANAGWIDPRQRELQRKRAQAIGDGTADPLPLAEVMDLDQMIERQVFISDGSRVTYRDRPDVTLPLNEFGRRVAASQTTFGNKTMPTIAFWVQDPRRITTDTITFRPGSGEFTRDPDGKSALNTWRKQHRPPSSASVDLFLDHVSYLVPIEEEREWFLNWLAHIEQCPGELPHSHVLFVTPQTGIGRNLLASVLARVWSGATRLGFDLMSSLHSGFNGGLSRRLLVIVDELKSADTPHGSVNVAEQLKSMLTTEHRGINPKYGRQFVEFNSARFLMFSQHYDALPLARTDRRIVVISNPTERRSPDYYRQAYQRLEDPSFINAVANWLGSRDISGFNPSVPAPMSESKEKAIDACVSDLEKALIDLRDGTEDKVMTSAQIGQYLADCGVRGWAGRAISAAYAAVGFVPCTQVVMRNGKRQRVVALREGDRLKGADSATLSKLLDQWD